MQALTPKGCPSPNVRRRACALTSLLTAVGLAASAVANPVSAVWPVSGNDDTSAVAAAPFSGLYAAADAFEDTVEIRDVRQTLLTTISKAQIQALLPWMSLDAGPDGPSAITFSASGRLLFILVHDDTIPGDGLGSDAVLRYDLGTGTLNLFARLEAFDRGDQFPHLSMLHNKGVLFVGTAGAGIKIYGAAANTTVGTLVTTWNPPPSGGNQVRGLTIDRDGTTLWAATDSGGTGGVYRTTIPASFATTPTWTQIAFAADARALAWGDVFGAAANRGLYILSGTGASTSKIEFLTPAQATGAAIVSPTLYLNGVTTWHDLAPTADGKLLIGADEDAVLVSDTFDTRLNFNDWLENEFQQVVSFGRGLISPDGEPAGWVIDADVLPANNRFHPATPDAACWTVLLLLMSEEIGGDPLAQQQVRTILTRYAGLATDNIKPSRTADGIYRHWIDPLTGNTKPGGWDPEYATLSTMKIVAAAARAMSRYPDDPEIVRAASRIIFRTKNWSAYIGPGQRLYFKGLVGGNPDTSSFSLPFNEGVIFVEQAAVYGSSAASYTYWLNRAVLPSATFVTGMPITSTSNGGYDAAFISLYPFLLQPAYRASASWRAQVAALRWSNSAWTDDNAPRFMTVFSAGTTDGIWGGYNADSLGNHPGNLTTFTSLMAMSAMGDTSPAVGAYHAYRKGARQTFKTGASILYRRSDVNRTYLPDSAGLPDVALGALGLAELIQPGSVDAVLSLPYPTQEMCPVDLNADGVIDEEDLYRAVQSPTDINVDGLANAADAQCLRNWLRRNEVVRTNVR